MTEFFQQHSILVIIFIVAILNQVTRLLPLIISNRFLQNNYLLYMNKFLPFAILVILLISSLNWVKTFKLADLVAEVLALLIVVFSYIKLNNFLLSICLGIFSLNMIYLLF